MLIWFTCCISRTEQVIVQKVGGEPAAEQPRGAFDDFLPPMPPGGGAAAKAKAAAAHKEKAAPAPKKQAPARERHSSELEQSSRVPPNVGRSALGCIDTDLTNHSFI